MDWYFGSDVNDYLIPRDQDLLDIHPSPDYWSNWEISAAEGSTSPKQFFIMDFFEEKFNNQIELEPSLHDKDQFSRSSVCGRLPEQSFQQTALSCDQPNYQLQDLPRFEQMNDSFLNSVREDLSCVDVENLDKVIISPIKQSSSTPDTLQKNTTDSKYVSSNSASKDCPDREASPAKVLDPFEQCSKDDDMHESSSLEEFILKDLEMVIGQFTEKTRLCFRDALYRLARNTEQLNEMLDQNQDFSLQKTMPRTDHNEIKKRTQEEKSMESTTNNIDRIIASLMFKSMEFNIHDPPLTPSTNFSESLNMEEKSDYSYAQEEKSDYSYFQELPTDVQISRFGLSNQLRDIGSYTTCEDPVKKSFMFGYG
ncbi:unnamed protein product [Sphenostylis stenocarpa]|uniref:Protein LNK3 n=1 Tax=Sphenostylis stenocarpa TaxID=92480 RepID=A0AA86VF06_9FABA|nr:unnamed protein product [Sphenostylis stenocarpa]